MDDRHLEDAAFWSMIDSAAAASSVNNNKLRLPPPSPAPVPSNQLQFRPPNRTRPKSELGEVVQPDNKKHKLVQESVDRRIVVSDNRVQMQQTPVAAVGALRPIDLNHNAVNQMQTPEKRRVVVNQVSPLIESPLPEVSKYRSRHSLLLAEFPSVATFKQYQEMALQILDKSDYTMISGNPYIKKSGWRKMSFFFDISYEIKDKTIERDENHNVRRAEFLVRAHMQGGRYSDGWGSCEQREKRFNKPNHDIPSTAETRAKNKAIQDLLGIGNGSKH